MKIGIIGGGQLGKMLIEEAHRWNVECHFLEAQSDAPASIVCAHQVLGSLQDREAIYSLAQKCDVLTYEIEHINVDALLELESEGKKIIPSASILAFIQDKYLQKIFFQENDIPTAAFYEVRSKEDFMQTVNKIASEKIVIKTKKGGYDGKGVFILAKKDIDMDDLPFGGVDCILEECIDFSTEISVMVARDAEGNIACYPPVEMEFDPIGNLVKYVFCPSLLDSSIQIAAQEIVQKCIAQMKGVGLFAVEMFLDKEHRLYVNEIAPRPHNSGHQTIECSYTSQYEQLLRILLHKPLGSTATIQPAVMINIIGPNGWEGAYQLDGENELLQIEGLYIHLYGKKISKPLRKLGHITVLGKDIEDLRQKINLVESHLKIAPASMLII